jgi:hypothetical protein
MNRFRAVQAGGERACLPPDLSVAHPLASVALCTYNGGKFLAEHLESLLQQTYPNIEIVVADDASTDDTLNILNHYARLDARIKVDVNPQNLGFTRNFERAMARCRGAYVAPSDQDDVWAPEKISALVSALGASSLAYCDSTLIDERGEPMGPCMSQVVPMLSTDDPAIFAFGNCVSGHAMLFRRELLDRALPVPCGFFHDWWIAAVAASAGGIAFCPQALVLYRQHGANVTETRFAEMLKEAGLPPLSGAAAQPRVDRTRARGRKLRYLQETEERLEALARLPGRHQAFLRDLQRLWGARRMQWFSPSLGWLMARNGNRLLALTQLSGKKKRRYCRQFFWGVRFARLLDPEAYASA